MCPHFPVHVRGILYKQKTLLFNTSFRTSFASFAIYDQKLFIKRTILHGRRKLIGQVSLMCSYYFSMHRLKLWINAIVQTLFSSYFLFSIIGSWENILYKIAFKNTCNQMFMWRINISHRLPQMVCNHLLLLNTTCTEETDYWNSCLKRFVQLYSDKFFNTDTNLKVIAQFIPYLITTR